MHLPTHLGTPLDPCRVSPFLGLPPFTTDRLERLPLAPPPLPPPHHAHQTSHTPGPIHSPSGSSHPTSPHPFYPYLPLHPSSAAVAAAMATHHALQPMLLFQQHLAALSASLHSSHAQSHAHITPGPACSPLILDRLPAGTIPMPASALLPTSLPATSSTPSSPASNGSSGPHKHHHHHQHQGHSNNVHGQHQQKAIDNSSSKIPSNGVSPAKKPTVCGRNTNLHTVERIMAPTPTSGATKPSTSPDSPADLPPLSPSLALLHKHSLHNSINNIQDHQHNQQQQHHRPGQASIPPILPSVRRASSASSPTSSCRSPNTSPPTICTTASNTNICGIVNTSPAPGGCGFKPSKTTSIADLRLKARQHLASLGI
ncbi:hypothetical protein RRG08_010448 [Elysia crispata]|uniref:OAR domain-containing protein n=1 Tax=Elysia crispata TaxID=231223 RepID=A0AAE1EC38_9GAST|nr:hypothetical protein RRG08_010448 [Elysia crispata]